MSITHGLAALAVTVAVLLGIGLYETTKRLGAVQVQLEAAQKAGKRNQATSVFRERKRAATAASAASAGHVLDKAVEANRPWADQPVPQEVQDALAS